MSKELRIIIAGEAATGKSTVMADMERLLKENGYNVELQFDRPDISGEEAYFFRMKHGENLAERISVIKANTKITLMEKQLRRGFNEKPETIQF